MIKMGNQQKLLKQPAQPRNLVRQLQLKVRMLSKETKVKLQKIKHRKLRKNQQKQLRQLEKNPRKHNLLRLKK